MGTDAQIAQCFPGMWPQLDEYARRLAAASKAVELGYGGIARVGRACGLSRVALTEGVEQLQPAPLGTPIWGATPALSMWARIMTPACSRRLRSAVGGAPKAAACIGTRGGCNGWRLRLWKWEFQRLAGQTGLTLTVCHFPPDTANGTRWIGRS